MHWVVGKKSLLALLWAKRVRFALRADLAVKPCTVLQEHPGVPTNKACKFLHPLDVFDEWYTGFAIKKVVAVPK